MFNQSPTQTRRNFLKGAVYTSALTFSGFFGLTSLTMAAKKNVMQHQPDSSAEVINLINHTASPVRLDKQSTVSIAPGEQRSFVVAALTDGNNSTVNRKNLFITDVLVNDQLAIRSDYPEFNGIFPVTQFGMQAV